jgi:glycosyltransferase involved in cell wall biosynthesis
VEGADVQTGRIGFLIPEFPGQTHIAWWRVANELRALGCDVQLISTKPGKDKVSVHSVLAADAGKVFYAWPPGAGLAIREAVRNPAGVFRGVTYLLSLRDSSLREKLALFPVLISAISLSGFLRKRDIDPVFVHSCANAAHLVALCNRIMGVRYALRLGGDPKVYGKDHHHKMERAEFVLSASPTYFDELVGEHGVDRSKLYWSWVGTDLSAYTVDPSWPQNDGADGLRILTVARLNETKGHLYALEAVRDLVQGGVEATYTLVGEGPFRKALEEKVASMGLGDRVRIVGQKDTQEIAAMLRQSDVAILASFGAGEAAPAVICEAMAAGVPVISTRIGVTDHMIVDGVDGFLVDQRDSAAIRDRLRTLATDRAGLARMKRAAREASAKYDVRQTAVRLLALFEETAARR